MPLYQSGFLVTYSKCLVIFGLTSQVSQLSMPLYRSGFLVTCSECLVIFGLTGQVSQLPVSLLKPGIPSLSAILFPVRCLSPSSSGCWLKTTAATTCLWVFSTLCLGTCGEGRACTMPTTCWAPATTSLLWPTWTVPWSGSRGVAVRSAADECWGPLLLAIIIAVVTIVSLKWWYLSLPSVHTAWELWQGCHWSRQCWW